MQIPGRVFVVTGGGDGIGREVVLELLRRGGRVAAVDLRAEALAELVHLADVPAGALSVHCLDITDRTEVEALPAEVIAEHGAVDGLLNVAGIIQHFVPVSQVPLAEAERLMAVNFWGTFFMVQAFLPELMRRPEASLVNVASMGALVPVPGQSVYGASKGAVRLLTEGLYAELRGSKVAVTVVFPGGVGTKITEHSGVEVPRGAAGASFPVTPAPEAGRQIVQAVERGTFRVLIGRDARMLDRLSRLSPTRAIGTVADRMKALLG